MCDGRSSSRPISVSAEEYATYCCKTKEYTSFTSISRFDCSAKRGCCGDLGDQFCCEYWDLSLQLGLGLTAGVIVLLAIIALSIYCWVIKRFGLSTTSNCCSGKEEDDPDPGSGPLSMGVYFGNERTSVDIINNHEDIRRDTTNDSDPPSYDRTVGHPRSTGEQLTPSVPSRVHASSGDRNRPIYGHTSGDRFVNRDAITHSRSTGEQLTPSAPSRDQTPGTSGERFVYRDEITNRVTHPRSPGAQLRPSSTSAAPPPSYREVISNPTIFPETKNSDV